MKASWKTAGRKANNKLTMRDVDAIIAEVRAGHYPDNYKPVTLTISLPKADAAWLNVLAAHAAELVQFLTPRGLL